MSFGIILVWVLVWVSHTSNALTYVFMKPSKVYEFRKILLPMPNLADHSYLCVRNLLQDLNKNYGKDLRSKQLEKQIFS